MHLLIIFAALGALTVPTSARDPLEYAADPVNVYTPSNNASVVTLLEYINSRDDLSSLATMLKEPAGIQQTNPQTTVPLLTASQDSRKLSTRIRLGNSHSSRLATLHSTIQARTLAPSLQRGKYLDS